MTTLLSFIKRSDGYFEPEVLGAMAIAYDAVRKSLGSAATVAVAMASPTGSSTQAARASAIAYG